MNDEATVVEPSEQFIRPAAHFLTRPRVEAEGGTGQEDRSRAIETLHVQILHRTTRTAEDDQEATRPQAGQAGVESCSSDAVVHNSDALAVGELPHRRGDVDISVITDHIVGSGPASDLLFLRCRNGADDPSAAYLRDLGHELADSPCGGMDQDRLTGLTEYAEVTRK